MKILSVKAGKWLFLSVLPLVGLWFASLESRRTRIVVTNEKNQVLLIKSWFGRQEWGLPGGGIKSTESLKRAALRELHEETGIMVDSEALIFLDQKAIGESLLRYRAYVFRLTVTADTQIAPLPKFRKEIIAIEWRHKQHVPANIKRDFGAYL